MFYLEGHLTLQSSWIQVNTVYTQKYKHGYGSICQIHTNNQITDHKLTCFTLMKKGIPNEEKISLWKCATGISISSSAKFTSSRGISSILENITDVQNV